MNEKYILEAVGLNSPTRIRVVADCGVERALETRLLDINATVGEWRRYFAIEGQIKVKISKELLNRISQKPSISKFSVKDFFEMANVVFEGEEA